MHISLVYARLLKAFQSLLHQGISLLNALLALKALAALRFQSLLHQGISLLSNERSPLPDDPGGVSIPSSSGHQFTGRWGGLVQSAGCRMFQSLLHQGISLLGFAV